MYKFGILCRRKYKKVEGGFIKNKELIKLLNCNCCCNVSKEQYDLIMKNVSSDNGKEFNYGELITINSIDYSKIPEEVIKSIQERVWIVTNIKHYE